MEVIVLPTAQDVGIAAAGMIARLVANKPDAVLGLATGASVTAVYEELKALDFSRVTTFNLDEYVGLARSEEHTSELQSRLQPVCRLLLEKKKKTNIHHG